MVNNNDTESKRTLKSYTFINSIKVSGPPISLMFLTTTANLLIPLQPYLPHCYSRSSPTFALGVFSPRNAQGSLVNFLTSFSLFSKSPAQSGVSIKIPV